MPGDAERIVGRQLDAYNAKDIDAFAACWHADARIFAHPDTLLVEGIEAIRARHVLRFQEPDLFGKLLSRISVGNLVVDHELVTRNFPEGLGEVDVIAIYEVVEGRIAAAWFKQGEVRLRPQG
ncbi:MAG: nuclear transport factor 2 family protein [Proteobacteria bacterium]|nr:nuclear transport factor 2 family protein [Pseudomonadota bacterium]